MTIKKINIVLVLLLFIVSSCRERVEPNYYGVLMENYGKNGKSDFSIQQGMVSTLAPGSTLYQVPGFEQRATFSSSDGKEQILHLKASDNTEFTARPLYSYKITPGRQIDVVFQNARLGDKDFMRSLEDNVLEPHIYDLIKEESRKYITDSLMMNGGSLKFENRIQNIIKKSFEEKGLDLITFSSNLDFSDKVKAKIDSRNEVNTNVSVLDQQIIEQKKRNELAELQAQENIILSKGLTPQILEKMKIEVWDKHGAKISQVNSGGQTIVQIPTIK